MFLYSFLYGDAVMLFMLPWITTHQTDELFILFILQTEELEFLTMQTAKNLRPSWSSLTSLRQPSTGSLEPGYRKDYPLKILPYQLDIPEILSVYSTPADRLYRSCGYKTGEQVPWRCHSTQHRIDPPLGESIRKPFFWIRQTCSSIMACNSLRSNVFYPLLITH